MQAATDALQVVLEESVLELARWLHDASGCEDLCMAGGVALNCVMNARIRDRGPFRRIWVQPASGDAGTALGAALWIDAKERGAIITSLLPPGPGAPPAEDALRATNEKVLGAFRSHLLRSGLSPKVTERDLTNATIFAEGYLLALPEPISLRDFDGEHVREYMGRLASEAGLKEARRRESLLSLKRLIRFLRDTHAADRAQRTWERLVKTYQA